MDIIRMEREVVAMEIAVEFKYEQLKMLLSYPRIAVLITDATDNSNVRKVANTVHRQPKPNANVKSPALSSVASHI